MSAEADVASLVLAALSTQRFVFGTRCLHGVCISDKCTATPILSEPVTWVELISATVSSDKVNNSTLLWLAGEQVRSAGATLVKALLKELASSSYAPLLVTRFQECRATCFIKS